MAPKSNSVVYEGTEFAPTNLSVSMYSSANMLPADYIDDLKKKSVLPKDACCFVPTNPEVRVDWSAPRWIAIHEYPFRLGMLFWVNFT